MPLELPPDTDTSAMKLPRPTHGVLPDLLEPLSSSADLLEDTSRMEEILREELRYLSADSLMATVFHYYHLDEGAEPAISSKWERETATARFPVTDIQGHVTEVGFRRMVRCAVFGGAKDISHRQPRGKWCLEKWKVKKEAQETAARQTGPALVNPQQVIVSFGMEGSGFAGIDPVSSRPSVTPGKGKDRARRQVFNVHLTYVDITGSERVVWREGRMDDGTWSAQKTSQANIERLLEGLERVFAGAPAVRLATRSPDAPVSNEPDPQMKAIAELARQAGLEPAQLVQVLGEYVNNRNVTPPQGAPALPDGFVVEGTTLKWKCPVCARSIAAAQISVSQHLAAHQKAGEIDDARKAALLTGFVEARSKLGA